MRAIPFESIIISVVLEQAKRIRALEWKIQETSKIQEAKGRQSAFDH
jgi:hypothetical protein